MKLKIFFLLQIIAQELKKLGFTILGTSGTSDFLNSSGVDCKKIMKVRI